MMTFAELDSIILSKFSNQIVEIQNDQFIDPRLDTLLVGVF